MARTHRTPGYVSPTEQPRRRDPKWNKAPTRPVEIHTSTKDEDKSLAVIKTRLYNVSSLVARTVLSQVNWSMFHSWHLVQSVSKNEGASFDNKFKKYAAVWRKEKKPAFGNCVDIANFAMEELKTEFRGSRTKIVRSFARKVKLLSLWEEDGWGDQVPDHCVAVVETEWFAIVLDLTFHPDALVVPLGGERTHIKSQLDLRGRRTSVQYRYVEVEDGKRQLQYGNWDVPEDKFRVFMPIQYKTATRDITFVLASHMLFRNDEPTFKVGKYLTTTMCLKDKPKEISSIKGPQTLAIKNRGLGGYMTVMGRLSVSYEMRSILCQVPRTDFLLKKPELLARLEKHGMIKEHFGNKVTNIILDLDDTKDLYERIEVLCQVGLGINLPDSEVYKMAGSVLESGTEDALADENVQDILRYIETEYSTDLT